MKKWKCTVCGYVYDESKEGIPFTDLTDDWTCPQCGAPKSAFIQIEGEETITGAASTVADKIVEQLAAYGVKRVYEIPGDSNLPLTEAIRKAFDSPLPALVEVMVDLNIYIKGVHRK